MTRPKLSAAEIRKGLRVTKKQQDLVRRTIERLKRKHRCSFRKGDILMRKDDGRLFVYLYTAKDVLPGWIVAESEFPKNPLASHAYLAPSWKADLAKVGRL